MGKGLALAGVALLVVGGVFLLTRNTSPRGGFTPGFGMGYYGGFHDTGGFASPNTGYGMPFYGGFHDESQPPQRSWAMPFHGGPI